MTNNKEINECFYRRIFDGFCAEYEFTSFEEKEKILEELVKNNVSLKLLAVKMIDFCNNKANKNIKMSHVVFGLADLLEEFVRRKINDN
jgi:hypothetical protein